MAKKKVSKASSENIAAAAAASLAPDASPTMNQSSSSLQQDPNLDPNSKNSNDSDTEKSQLDSTTATSSNPPTTNNIRVNNSSLSELKIAMDDVIKEFFSRSFTMSHVHEDVRLCLGWGGVIVAAITGYYGYVNDFEQSKFGCGVGVALYVILSSMFWFYVTCIEKDTIFQGKRRTFASRISTENLTLSSSAESIPPHLQSSFSILNPLSFFSSTKSTTKASKDDSAKYPLYHLHLNYTHSSNNGKSLIRSFEKEIRLSLADYFDTEGRMDRVGLEKKLDAVMRECVEG